jgi:LPS-assembly protein
VHALAALVAAGLILAAPSSPTLGGGDARIEAGSATYDIAAGTYRLEGGVVIRRGLVTLRARGARWNPRTSEVVATGGVMLSDARRSLSAEGLRAVLDGDIEATGVVLVVKEGAVDLSGATTAAEAAACGPNAAEVRAGRLSGRLEGALLLEKARLSLCDCPSGPPTWSLRSSRVEVDPGVRAGLSWPVLWVTPRFLLIDEPVPVFALPYLSVPLTDRLSGLLVPQIGSSGTSGLTLGQPWFQTLGPSADLTVVPRYAFGRSRTDVAEGKAAVRGPGAELELRWAPWVDAGGKVAVNLLWDLDREAGGTDGLRLALQGVHQQRLGAEGLLRAELDLVGDPLYVRDFTPDVLLRGATSRRSAVDLSWRWRDAVPELSAAWLEPVSSSGALASVEGGVFGARLPAFHRWPAATVTLLPTALAGPLFLAGRAGLSRFAPPTGATSDGGADGLGPAERAYTGVPDAGELDGTWQPGERLAATRLDARADLSAPHRLGRAMAVAPFLRGAALGYLFDTARDPVANAWGLVGVEISTAVARRWGEVRHAVEPRLDWRIGSAVQGPDLPASGYDGWDRASEVPPGAAPEFAAALPAAAAPPGVFHQARLAVMSRFVTPSRELARLELGQELDLRRGALAEGWVALASSWGPVSAEADARFWTAGRLEPAPSPQHPSWLDSFSELRLSVALADGRGDQLYGRLFALGAGGSGRLGAGADALFDARTGGAVAEPAATGTLGGRVRMGPASAGYEALLPARVQAVPACQGSGTRVISAWQVQQHNASLDWDSPCRCFRARAVVRITDCGDIGYGLTVDLGRVGGTLR